MKSDPIHQQRAQDAKTRGTMAQDAATRRLATAADGARRAGWDAAREPSETASQDGRGLEAVPQVNSEERAAEITRGSERATPPCSDQALTPGEGIDTGASRDEARTPRDQTKTEGHSEVMPEYLGTSTPGGDALRAAEKTDKAAAATHPGGAEGATRVASAVDSATTGMGQVNRPATTAAKTHMAGTSRRPHRRLRPQRGQK